MIAAKERRSVGKKYPEPTLDVPEVSEQLTLSFARDAAALAASDHVHRWYDYV